jgi:hypothetical protein
MGFREVHTLEVSKGRGTDVRLGPNGTFTRRNRQPNDNEIVV